jgi:hypothetical protein
VVRWKDLVRAKQRAVIGAGAALFERWGAAKRIFLDCGNRQVKLVA